MRIGIGATALMQRLQSGHVDGIGSYTENILQQLLHSVEYDTQIYSYQKLNSSQYQNLEKLPGFYPINAAISTMTRLPFFGVSSLQSDIDIFHATDQYIPDLRSIPVVATLMDPISIMRPEWCRPGLRPVKNFLFKSMVSKADYYITISNYVVKELVEHFKVPKNKISVVPLAVSDHYFHKLTLQQKHKILNKYDLKPGYFLFIGTLQPRKNLERILDAFESLPDTLKSTNPLVVVGDKGWKSEHIIDRLSNLGPHAKWLRYVPQQEKLALLQSAGALVFPSIYEGFGLPVLEAFASSLPVITSNITALPEVAGDAAVLVDPYSVVAIANAMQELITNETLRNELIIKGLERARQMTWVKTSQSTLEVYKKILNQ